MSDDGRDPSSVLTGGSDPDRGGIVEGRPHHGPRGFLSDSTMVVLAPREVEVPISDTVVETHRKS